MITWARYVREDYLEPYLQLGWMVRDVSHHGELLTLLLVWVCPCNMVEPAK